MLESTIILENQFYTAGRDEQTHSPWDEDVRAKIQINLVGRSNNRGVPRVSIYTEDTYKKIETDVHAKLGYR